MAARWARETQAAHWRELIEQALTWRKDRVWGAENQLTSPGNLAATQALIRYTYQHCQM